MAMARDTQKSQGGEFFLFFEGEIKKTAWNLWAKRCQGKTGERAKWTGRCKDGCGEEANYPNDP